MHPLDRFVETSSRSLAQRTSRRSLLAGLGRILTGAALLPLLPVDRASRASAATPARGGPAAHSSKVNNDPRSCEYWRYCAIDGYLCSCCGGSTHQCPPGTRPSAVTWVGTCHNPADGHDYVVSYNDCCGKSSCGRCFCNRNEGDKPLYVPFESNDYNWCAGSQSGIPYHCSTSRIVALAK